MENHSPNSIFLSYAHGDYLRLEPLLAALSRTGLAVWRDAEKLRGGQLWPQRLGEEIHRHPAVLLAWSENSHRSHFVNFEWNTALALKRTVIILRLDNAKVPPSLSAMHNILMGETANTTRAVVEALGSVIPHSEPSAQAILSRLGSLPDGQSPEEQKQAVAGALAIYQNSGLITGHVTAGGDVNINFHPPTPPAPPRDPTGYPLLTTILGSLGGIAALATVYFQYIKPDIKPAAVSVLRGIVEEEDQAPVPGARVTLVQKPGDTVFTNDLGGFFFDSVPGVDGNKVRVYVQSEGYMDANLYFALPGPAKILLKKKP